MCGIVALITNYKNGFDSDEVKAFGEMLYVNALRGTDSTGIFYVTNKREVQIHKDITESSKFLDSKEWETSKGELYSSGSLIVGHCRAKTRGANTDENAHPFNVDNKIVLVHNGTYVGDHKHLKNVEVDSHAIAHVIAEAGEDVEAALQKINAAYALVWYNNETKTLNAIRNKERPLFYAETETGSMLLASESSFIYLAAWRNGIKINKDGVNILPEHTLLTVPINPGYKREYTFEDIDAEYRHVYQRTMTPVQDGKIIQLPHSGAANNWRSKSRLTMLEAAKSLGHGDYEVGNGEHFRQWLARDEEIVVEAVDYRKVDPGDANDKNYYIFGKILKPGSKADDFAVGWEICAPDEKAVMDYVCGDFPYFEGKIEHGLYRPWIAGEMTVAATALFRVYSMVSCSNLPVGKVEN